MNDPNNALQTSAESVTRYFQIPDLLRDLLLQLTKDFQTAQIPLPLNLDENYSFEGLCQGIASVLEAHTKKAGSLKNLLNRVDLTEKQIKKYIPNSLNAHLNLLAELIIKRELQKVVIRHWYRQSSEK